MVLDQSMQGPERRSACADLVGQGRKAEINALTSIALALAVEWLMLAKLLEQHHSQQIRPGEPRGVTWNGAGRWVIASDCRHESFSRTVWMTFHWRGITSSVSVTSSPSFDSLVEPQQGEL